MILWFTRSRDKLIEESILTKIFVVDMIGFERKLNLVEGMV